MVTEWIKLVESQEPVCRLELWQEGLLYAKSLGHMTFGEALAQGIVVFRTIPDMTYKITCVQGVLF